MKNSGFYSQVVVVSTLFLTALGAGAGDWKSAGLPMRPYDPPYEYEYACQLEVVGASDARSNRHVAETSFTISSVRKTAEKFEWIHKLYDGALRPMVLASPAPFRLDGHRADLYFRPGDGDDRVVLRLMLEEILEGKYKVTYSREEQFHRSDVFLAVNVSMTSRRLDQAEHRNEAGYLKCRKVK